MRKHIVLVALAIGCDPVPQLDPDRTISTPNQAIAFRINDHPVYMDSFELAMEAEEEGVFLQAESSSAHFAQTGILAPEEETAVNDYLIALRPKIRDALAQQELLFQYASSM